MEYCIQGRAPARLYQFFEEISAIPRGSGNEEAISQYLVNFAEHRGLNVYRDDLWNVIIRKEGQLGGQAVPPILLECHTDMVCAQEPGHTHDFLKDPIHLIQEGNILRADGTTLGADNGCGVAILLFLLDSDSLPHPPLECFFAAKEEIGCIGAEKVDMTQFHARRAIGLDAGSDGVFCKGTTTKYNWQLQYMPEWIPNPAQHTYRIQIAGLRGGYPALCLPLERTNAIHLLGKALHTFRSAAPLFLSELHGQQKGLVEQCSATFSTCLPEEALQSLAESLTHRWHVEYADGDPDITLKLEPQAAAPSVASQASSQAIVDLMIFLPYGVYSRNPVMPTLVNSFVNPTRISLTSASHVCSIDLLLSAESREKARSLREYTLLVLERFGGNLVQEQISPGWEVRPHSPIRDTMTEAYHELFGKDPFVKISHGGNDCVKLIQRMPELDVVTCAADYLNFHTPKEYLDMDSFERLLTLVIRTLKKLVEEG